MVTKIEIEAVAEALSCAIPGLVSPEALARAALEAAERVRPRETSTERVRKHRARKRNVSGVASSPGNVSGNVSSPSTATHEELLARLIEAAAGNVRPGAIRRNHAESAPCVASSS
jgi:hypothetical protein